MDSLKEFLDAKEVEYEINIPLSKKTWVKTGGECAYWIVPQSVMQMTEVCRYMYVNKVEFDIVGQTSNMFFHSTYHPQVVVSTLKVNHYEIKEDVITCDCGALVVKLAKDCLSRGYAGFYGLTGLPGTVAASVSNNAGCFDCSISSMLVDAECLFPDGTIRKVCPDELHFSRRSSALKRKELKCVILSVTLCPSRASSIEEETAKAHKAMDHRRNHQERNLPNLGSVFCRMSLKRNVRNIVSVSVARIQSILGISEYMRVFKRMQLALYGYRDLDPYISDKNIDIFIWRDSGAEEAFERYKQFMKAAYKKLSIEIEEKA